MKYFLLIIFILLLHSDFEAKNINFPGQTYKWRLARWLQLGYPKSSNSIKIVNYNS
jgi:hypothetical protein